MTKHNIIITACFLMYILALVWFIGYVMGTRRRPTNQPTERNLTNK